MLKEELLKRSPIRILEKGIHGGLGKGNLGVFTARKGVGKTASLVHFAIDRSMRGEKILHISFADDPHHIENWYKQVFEEVSKTYKLEFKQDIFDSILSNRLILHFKKQSVTFESVKEKINSLIQDTQFSPSMVIVDGYPFEEMAPNQLENWKQLASELGGEMWFSATLHREKLNLDEDEIPAPINRFKSLFSVIIMLNPMQNYIALNLLKDHHSANLEKLHVKLDPGTLLITNHRV